MTTTTPNIVGTDHVGTIARQDGFAYYLTACCQASAKGSANVASGVCCRACYAEVDPRLGGLPAAKFWDAALAAKLGVR